MELQRFALKWSHPDYPPKSVEIDQVESAEAELGIKFPSDYREQILRIGLPSPSLALLSSICDRDIDIPDLSSLHQPLEVAKFTSLWWAAGMPQHLVAIGTDCAGNSFCFDARDLRAELVQTAPVFLWDHDFGTTKRVESSFADWIALYLGSWSDNLTYRDF